MTSWGTAAVLFTGGVCEREPRHGHVRPQFSFRSCLIRILIHIFAAADTNFSPAAEQPARARAHARTATHTHTRSRVRQREMWSSIHKKKISPPSSRTSHLNAPTHPSSPSSILQSSSVLLSHAHTHAHTPSMTGNVQGRSPPSPPPPPPPTPASKARQLRGGGGGGSHIPAVTGSSCAPEPSTQHSRAFFLFVLFFVFTPLPSLQH